MSGSSYARVKRKPKKSKEDEGYKAPPMFSEKGDDTAMAAINSVDQVARQLEQRFGLGKLERLAAPKLAVAFEQARQNFNDAIQGDDSSYLVQKANNLIEGWKALERSAIKDGHKPQSSKVWEFYAPEDVGGQKYAIVDEVSDAASVEGDTRIYTLDEVARVIIGWENTKLGLMAAATKQNFPDAQIKSVKYKKTNEVIDDEIPF